MSLVGKTIDPDFRHPLRPNGPTLAERFWAKVNKDGPLSKECGSPCWEWTASLQTAGYGQIGIGRRPEKAHVVSWALAHENRGPDEGLCVCHRCDNPKCVNPAHLFLGKHVDNMRDAQMKGRAFFKMSPKAPRPVRPAMARGTGKGPLVDWLRLAGFTESQLADAIGVSRQAVNWWTHGVCVPSEEFAGRIAEFSEGGVPTSVWTRKRRPPGNSDAVKAMLAEIQECKARVRQLRANIKLAQRGVRVEAA